MPTRDPVRVALERGGERGSEGAWGCQAMILCAYPLSVPATEPTC